MPTAFVALDDRVLGVDVDRPDTTETLAETSPECIAASPAVPERLFLGTVDSGLLRSDDGGDTWRNVLVAGDRVTAVRVSPNDPDVVWAGTEPSAVYRSTDGGDSWQDRPSLTDLPSASSWSFPPRPHTHHVRWLAEAPTDPDTLYVAIEAGALVRTHDGGETWLDRPSGSRRDTHTMATHPAEPDRLYVAAGDGYAESRDCGDTWLYPQDGLDHRYVWSVAVAPDDPETVVVSAANGPRQAHTPPPRSRTSTAAPTAVRGRLPWTASRGQRVPSAECWRPASATSSSRQITGCSARRTVRAGARSTTSGATRTASGFRAG
ncbi:hypothetical protein VB779_18070 [Haloarculaceae archaeon H-GB11]|nr:hypothetical protein [Haloarculaceae archaeon H-GB11]